jgi:hypothetical protein
MMALIKTRAGAARNPTTATYGEDAAANLIPRQSA